MNLIGLRTFIYTLYEKERKKPCRNCIVQMLCKSPKRLCDDYRRWIDLYWVPCQNMILDLQQNQLKIVRETNEGTNERTNQIRSSG